MNHSSELALHLPPARAFLLLLDLDRVVPCLPGATLGPSGPGRARPLEMTVKLGPMAFRYRGEIEILEKDAVALRALLRGTAREIKGQGTATADLVMSVHDDGDGGSRVAIDARVDLTGRAAQLGGGMVAAVADRLIDDLAACLQRGFASDASPARRSDPSSPDSGSPDSPREPTCESTPDRLHPPSLRMGSLVLRALRDRLAAALGRRH